MSGRPIVDTSRCEGHALCLSSAPDVFDLGPDERAIVLPVPITDELVPDVEEALRSCPTGAISWEDPGRD